MSKGVKTCVYSKMDVIIIGAGLAGLTCANILKQYDPELRVLVVEARQVIGGRVYTNETFSVNQPVEMGAELIHGTHTVLNQMLKEPTVPVYTWAHGDGGPHPDHPVSGGCGYYYIGAESKLLKYDSTDPDFVHLNKVLQDMPVGEPDNQTVLNYLCNNVHPRMLGLAEAGYANTFCSELSMLPRHRTAEVMNGFNGDGENELRCPSGYKSLLSQLRKNVEVWTDWPVELIKWGKTSVDLVSERGESLHASRVVLTPSIAVMKYGSIRFEPSLSQRRYNIYHSINMEPCLKLALRFSTRFWPDDFHGMICSECPIPEFWTITTNQDANEFILVGFSTATFASNLSKLSRQELRDTALAQLDRIFGNASESYVDMVVQDWTKDPYIRGGYSSPSSNVPTEDRAYIAQSIKNTLYFAGEATCPSRYMVMHAAMESGIRAANEIMNYIMYPPSTL